MMNFALIKQATGQLRPATEIRRQQASHQLQNSTHSPLNLAGAALLQGFPGGGPGKPDQTGIAEHGILRRRQPAKTRATKSVKLPSGTM